MRRLSILALLAGVFAQPLCAAAQTIVPPSGEWDVEEARSPVDDSPNVVLSINSDDTFEDRFGNPKWGKLYIACQDHSTAIAVRAGGQFLTDIQEFGIVTMRIDKTKAERREFSVSTNHEFIGLWNGQGIPLLKRLAAAQAFFIRITPFNESPVDMTFDVSKLSTVLPKLRAACNW